MKQRQVPIIQKYLRERFAMKNIKQLKAAIQKEKKIMRVRNMSNRAFSTLRSNFGFTYLD